MNREILQYQAYKNQLEQMSEYLKQLESQKQAIEGAIEALDDIKKSKNKTRILAAIASWIFVEATLENNSQVIVNAGANTSVKKDIEETKESLKKDLENIDNYIRDITIQKSQITSIMQIMGSEIMQKQKNKEE